MSFNLINPFLYTPYNQYSMGWSAGTTTALQISARTNSIDTQLRSANPTFTISCWVKILTAPGDAGGYGNFVFSKYKNAAGADRNFYLTVHNTGAVELYGTHNGSTGLLYRVTTQKLDTGGTTWYHLAFVYDSNKSSADEITRLFINGTSASSWSTNTVATTNKFFYNQTTEASRGYVMWGNSTDIANSPMNCRIDEGLFFKTALTNSEIVSLYNSGVPPDPSVVLTGYSSFCIGHYRMGDSSGDLFQNNNWTIQNVGPAGTTTENMGSSGMTLLSRVTEVP